MRAELAERQVGLGCEDQHEERGAEVEVTAEQTEADRHGDERHRDGRHQLEDQRREERESQRRHRGPPVPLGGVRDGGRLRLGPAEDLQRRQPGDDVEEMPAESCELQVALPGLVTGGRTDECHEHRHERKGHRDDRRGDPVVPTDDGQYRDRDDDREEELGEVAREVGVERIHPGDRQHGDPRPVDLGARRLGHLRDVMGQRATELRLRGGRRAVRRELGRPDDQRAPADRHQ